MFSGFGLVILLVITIALMIFLINKVKLHPFLAILLAAYFFALLGGVKLGDIDGVIRSGFGGLLAYIGIVIILGTIIGVILEKSGAAVSMANFALKTVGKKNPSLAMGFVGWLVSIPVFCDSGFVILTPLKKSLAKLSKSSMITMTVALSVGLYASHTLVPPTPGPIAAAGNLGIENSLGLVILFGVVVSLFALFAGYLYAKFIGGKIDDSVLDLSVDEELAEQTYGRLPSTFQAFLPILLPILLISIGTVANLPVKPLGEELFYQIVNFLGKPTTALLIGTFTALPLLKDTKASFNEIVVYGIKLAAPILLITAAGGAFGGAIKATTIAAYIGENLSVLSIGLLVPFFIAAALKTAQGSSTTALVVTSSIVAPLLPALGLTGELGAVLTVMAIGAGAMTISHSNDSYFWVVSQSSGMDTQTAYKTHSIATLIMGITSIIVTLILGFILL
ncbi:GntP family permease [Mycoplasmatota bacterium WC44]